MEKIIIENEIYIVSKNEFPEINDYYILNDKMVFKYDINDFDTVWKKRKILFTTNKKLILCGIAKLKIK